VPETLKDFIFDFGSLQKHQELSYIQSMLRLKLPEVSVSGQPRPSESDPLYITNHMVVVSSGSPGDFLISFQTAKLHSVCLRAPLSCLVA
jgi:hypothetical protein